MLEALTEAQAFGFFGDGGSESEFSEYLGRQLSCRQMDTTVK